MGTRPESPLRIRPLTGGGVVSNTHILNDPRTNSEEMSAVKWGVRDENVVTGLSQRAPVRFRGPSRRRTSPGRVPETSHLGPSRHCYPGCLPSSRV